MGRVERYMVDEKTAERVGDLLIQLFESCAEDREVYTIGELLEEVTVKLEEKIGENIEPKVMLRTAEVIGAMKQRYFGTEGVGGVIASLVALYLNKVKGRFSREEVRKNETES